MSRLTWDEAPHHEAGIDRGVFYSQNGLGEVWNGLTSVQESPSDSDARMRYIDGVKVSNRSKSGEFSGVIEAFTYSNSFYENVLNQKRRQNFGLSYRVKSDDSYKIHLVYNAMLGPSGLLYQQANTTPFSWSFTTKPVTIPGAKISAHLIIDASKAYLWTVTALENLLYGSDSGLAHLPTPEEVLDIFEVNSILRVIDHGDGSFTVTGPDDAIQMLDATNFQITWPSAVIIDEVSYRISSL